VEDESEDADGEDPSDPPTQSMMHHLQKKKKFLKLKGRL
jgi:hypothetical protein